MTSFRKRIIGCICIKNKIAVQSIGFKKYLPLGNPITIAENLQDWNVDEILFLDISPEIEINFKMIDEITSKINLPIQYSGAIRNYKDALQLISLGVDKVVLRSLFDIKHQDEILKIRDTIGKQSIVGSLPIAEKNNFFYYFDCNKRLSFKIDNIFKEQVNIMSNFFSEIIIMDFINDGGEIFNEKLFKLFNLKCKIIPFGGIKHTLQAKKLLKKNFIDGIAIGNSLSFRENAIYLIKNSLKLND
tara:strand:+ start:195 stop:929 length:735 start_codon:yes stop_codon:yes gene_type:complete